MEGIIVPQVEEQQKQGPFLHVSYEEVVRVRHERWVPCPFCHQPHVILHPGEEPPDVNICPTALANYQLVCQYDVAV